MVAFLNFILKKNRNRDIQDLGLKNVQKSMSFPAFVLLPVVWKLVILLLFLKGISDLIVVQMFSRNKTSYKHKSPYNEWS